MSHFFFVAAQAVYVKETKREKGPPMLAIDVRWAAASTVSCIDGQCDGWGASGTEEREAVSLVESQESPMPPGHAHKTEQRGRKGKKINTAATTITMHALDRTRREGGGVVVREEVNLTHERRSTHTHTPPLGNLKGKTTTRKETNANTHAADSPAATTGNGRSRPPV